MEMFCGLNLKHGILGTVYILNVCQKEDNCNRYTVPDFRASDKCLEDRVLFEDFFSGEEFNHRCYELR